MAIKGDSLCSFQLTNGRGSCRVFFYTAGAHIISIDYNGDGHYYGEYTERPYTVVGDLTPTPETLTSLSLTRLTAEPRPGEAVQFQVRVNATNSGPIPTGSVTISSNLDSSCSAALSNGEGMCSLTFATPGERTITATYPTNGPWVGSSDSMTLLANYPTQIVLTINPISPLVGQTINGTATVSVVNGGPVPTGVVAVEYGTAYLETDLVGGSANFTLTFQSAGQETIHAVYAPEDSTRRSTTDFRASEATTNVTVRAAAVQPPPEPPVDPGGGGSVGCMVAANDTFTCVVPCPDPNNYPEVCTIP